MWVDGYSEAWQDSAARDAQAIGKRLSASCRTGVSTRPLIAVWSPFPVESDASALVAGQVLLDPLTDAESVYPVAWREAVFAMARCSSTLDTAAHAHY